MPKKQNQSETQAHKIYVFISSTDNQFFVGKTTAKTADVAYKYHATGKHMQTKDLFAEARENHKFPTMYLVEEVNVTPETAFGYCVAWTKYFIEKGFTPLASQTVLSYTEDLTKENETIYNCIKDVPIEAVLNNEHLLKDRYKEQKKKKAGVWREGEKEQKIVLHLTPESYELLSYKARKANKSMSKYCQAMAMDGYIAIIDVRDYLIEVMIVEDKLQQILQANLQCEAHRPADIETIRTLIKELKAGRKEVVKALKQQTDKLIDHKKLQLENYRLREKIKLLEEKKMEV